MPKHEFVVETRSVDDNSSYLSFSWDSNGSLSKERLTETDYVSFDDEFIMYINDSLKWIPTWNPSTKEIGNGLNNYGVTIIDEQNLITFKGIIQAWTDMFGFATEKIVLTGSYDSIGETNRFGQYEKLLIDRYLPLEEMNIKKLNKDLNHSPIVKLKNFPDTMMREALNN